MGIFNFFKNKTNVSKLNEQNTNRRIPTLNYPIKCNSTKLFDINDLEIQFFEVLYEKLDSNKNTKITLDRMSNGTLNVCYNSCQVGRIKLQGKKHSMQILYNLYDSESFEGTIDDFIPKIDYWIKYILVYLK